MWKAKDPPFADTVERFLAKQNWVRIPWTWPRNKRRRAQTALEVLGPLAGPVAPQVAELLGTDEPTAGRSYTSVCLLSGMGQPAVPFLAKALSHRHAAVRQKASEALANPGLDIAEAIPALVKAMADPVKEVRHHAAEALGQSRCDPAVVVPVLVNALKDDVYVRREAVLGLGLFGTDARDEVSALTQIAKLETSDLKWALGISLWRIANGCPHGRSNVLDANYRLEKVQGALGQDSAPALQIDIKGELGRCVRSSLSDWVGSSGRFSDGRDGYFVVTLTNEVVSMTQSWIFGTNGLGLVIVRFEDKSAPITYVAAPLVSGH